MLMTPELSPVRVVMAALVSRLVTENWRVAPPARVREVSGTAGEQRVLLTTSRPPCRVILAVSPEVMVLARTVPLVMFRVP